jgi:hypothetical protein
MNRTLLAFICVLWLIAGCNTSHDATPKSGTKRVQPPKRTLLRFEEVRSFDGVTALADGGAYVDADGRLWYVRGAQAARVREVDPASFQAPPPNMTKREAALWAQLQAEITARKAAEKRADQAEEELASLDSPHSSSEANR